MTTQIKWYMIDGDDSGSFYSDGATPIRPFGEVGRLFLGESVGFVGATQGNNGATGSWLQNQGSGSSTLQYLETHSTLVSTNNFGVGVTGATYSSGGEASNLQAIGVAFVGKNNSLTSTGNVYGLYGEGIKEVSTTNSYTVGAEINAVNLPGASPLGGMTPNSAYPGGMVNCLWLAAGGDTNVNPTSYAIDSAIVVHNNGATFDSGFVFRNDALTRDGSGLGYAIRMDNSHVIGWDGGSDNVENNRLYSTTTNQATGQDLIFSDGGLNLRRRNDSGSLFIAEYVASNANWPQVAGNITGGAVKYKAVGSDANIDLQLEPKGTGKVKVSYAIGAASSPGTFSATHILQIKDGTGATFYVPAASAGW